MESDPIGLDGGLNTFGYVEANPLNYIDPFGLSSLTACANPANAAACAAAGIIPEGSSGAGAAAAVNATGIAIGVGVSPPLEMSRGKQKGRNWATENAKVEAQTKKIDPCDVIADWLEDAKKNGDIKQVQDLIQAEKFLDCRNRPKRKEKHRCSP